MKFLKSRLQRLSIASDVSNPEESEDAPPPYSIRYSVPPPQWRHTCLISSDLVGQPAVEDVVLPEMPLTPPSCETLPQAIMSTSSQTGVENEVSLELPPRLQEYVVHLKEKNNKEHSWAKLCLNYSNKTAQGVPSFEPGEVIHGAIELDMHEPKIIKEILVSIRGSWSAIKLSNSGSGLSADEPTEFLKITTTLWKSSLQDTDPRPFSEKPVTTRQLSLPNTQTSARLRTFDPRPFPKNGEDSLQCAHHPSSSGRQSLEACKVSFSLPLPEQAVMNGRCNFLPPSMSDGGPNSITYEISALFKTGLLQFSHNLNCPIEIMPVIYPPQLSQLRRVAYNALRIPPGPLTDPSGWTIASPRILNGRMFDTFDVSLHCTLAIANPTTYSCGGIVALQLLLECRGSSEDDQQAFTMLSNPSSIPICLVRTIVIDEPEALSRDGHGQTRSRKSNPFRMRSIVAMGTCWTDRRSEKRLGKRLLQMEIAVPGGLTPSFSFGALAVEYTILLLPLSTPGFVTQRTEALIEVPVTLVRGHSRYMTFAPTASRPAPAVDLPGAFIDLQFKSESAGWGTTSWSGAMGF